MRTALYKSYLLLLLWSRLGTLPFCAWKSVFVVRNKCQHVTWNKCLLPHVPPFLLLFIGQGMNMAVPQTAQIWSKQVLLLKNQASMFHTKPANGNCICTFSGQHVSSLGIPFNGTQHTDYLTLTLKLVSNVWPFARAQQHYLHTVQSTYNWLRKDHYSFTGFMQILGQKIHGLSVGFLLLKALRKLQTKASKLRKEEQNPVL